MEIIAALLAKFGVPALVAGATWFVGIFINSRKRREEIEFWRKALVGIVIDAVAAVEQQVRRRMGDILDDGDEMKLRNLAIQKIIDTLGTRKGAVMKILGFKNQTELVNYLVDLIEAVVSGQETKPR